MLHRNNDPLQEPIYKRPGTDLTVAWSFPLSGRSSYFCRGGCREDNFLLEKDGQVVTRGRYSYDCRDCLEAGGSVYVSITQLNESDSGRYRCGWYRKFKWYEEFDVVVMDGEFLLK